MKRKKIGGKPIGLMVLAMMLVLAMTFIGCDTGSGAGNGGGSGNAGGGTGSETDPALNGLWGEGEHQFFPRFLFNNGNVEYFSEYPAGLPLARGTFTTNNNILTMKFTHLNGSPFGDLGFGSRWYTMAEFRARAQAAGASELVLELDRYVIPPQTVSYFISGNTLTLVGNLFGDSVWTLHRR